MSEEADQKSEKGFKEKSEKKLPRKGSALKRLNGLKKNKKPSRKQANKTKTLKMKLKSRLEDIFSN